MVHQVKGEGMTVWECDGCGDTAYGLDAVQAWAYLVIPGAVRTFQLCSCDCFYAWNYHAAWPGPYGERPGAIRDPESPF
jgi:hypothetical protein